MLKRHTYSNTDAVSEVLGGLLLVVIAFIVIVCISDYIFPLPLPDEEPNVHITGYVTDEGRVILEHMGGESLKNYEVFIEGSLCYRNDNGNPWEIGERNYPPLEELLDEDEGVQVTVCTNIGGNDVIVFDGMLTRDSHPEQPPASSESSPALLSTLLTYTLDEDLICYSSPIEPEIEPLTFIYNWTVNDDPITNLFYPFDTNLSTSTKDYSGNMHTGEVNGATWERDGRVGGAYAFDGDDNITFPYVFSDDYLDKITVETWMKTNEDSGTISSFSRNKYWELAVADGVVKWSTTSNEDIDDMTGEITVNDDQWHHIATTYDSSSGDCGIYIDGILDTSQHVHDIGDLLGTGERPLGTIGKGSGDVDRETIFSTGFETQAEEDAWMQHNATQEEEITWDTLTFDDFAGGSWGNYVDGGSYCSMYPYFDHSGDSYCVHLQEDYNPPASSFYHASGIDVHTQEYTSICIDFWVYAYDTESGDNFYVEYYNGYTWLKPAEYIVGYHLWNNDWYHFTVYVNESEYNFPTNMRVRFRSDANWYQDHFFFDDIYVNASGGEDRIEFDFNRLDVSDIIPNNGVYSIGGTGNIAVDYAAYNRSGIDIAGYTNIELSVWYSYEDTEYDDFLGLYYLDDQQWIPLFEDDNPQIGSGQSDWVQIISAIPDDIDTLYLQFKWLTSSTSEHVAIDDLVITGEIPAGEDDFIGLIDELKIFNRVLSAEQIYQEYISSKDGLSSCSVIVAEEINYGDDWRCFVTPNDSITDGELYFASAPTIDSYPGGG